MTSPHPNITITDPTLTRDDIARLYSEAHADVWEIIRVMGFAAPMRPPTFDVLSLIATAGGCLLQSRGRKEVEKGWLELYPGEESSLERQLPEDADVLEVVAKTSQALAIDTVTVVRAPEEPRRGVNPGDLLRLMKDKGVGRPSTYAYHVENTFKAVETGLLSSDDTGGFHITESGLALLQCLDSDDDLPSLDVDYSARIEADLQAIEMGTLSAVQVLHAHLAKLPGVTMDVTHAPPASHDRSSQPPPAHRGEVRWPPFVLPAAIDPDTVLPPDHPLRVTRDSFDETLRQLYGQADVNRAVATTQRACRAAALAKLLGDLPLGAMVERLQLDLGLRWVVGLQPIDSLWTPRLLNELIAGQASTIERLYASVEQTSATALRNLLAETLLHRDMTPGDMTPAGQPSCDATQRHLLDIQDALDAIRCNRRPHPDTVAWPAGLDRNILNELPFKVRTRYCLLQAQLMQGEDPLTVRQLLRLANFGQKSLRDFLFTVEDFLNECLGIGGTNSQERGEANDL